MFNNVQELEALLTSALQVSASLGFEARPKVTFAVIDKVKCACPVAALALMRKVLPFAPPTAANDPTLTEVFSKFRGIFDLSIEQEKQLRQVAYGFDGGYACRNDEWDTPYTSLGRRLRPAKVA